MLCAALTGCSLSPFNSGAPAPEQELTEGVDYFPDIMPEAASEKDSELTPNIVDDNYRNYYEIFTGSYCDSNGDGLGDLAGIESKLDYISDLGCNGIWLTPIMASPSYHKYDTTDYYAVDPAFGTNDDFKSLADECHARGIRLIIDLVINHSSNEHPWFKEACDYLNSLGPEEEPDLNACPYVDYYHFSREKINSSYAEVPGGDWYYEAVFYYTQPDLNLENEDLVSELKNVASYWIDLGCDGFRMDAVMHYDEEASGTNIAFLHDYYEYCLSLDPDFYMVSEVWAAQKTIAEYYKSGTPSFFNFDAADAEGKLIRAGRGTLGVAKFAESCLDYQEIFSQSNPDFIDAPFITNHDMGRIANAVKSDPVSLKMCAGLLLSMSGSPFIYYGEEIGMKSKGKADENKRLHMNWSETDMTGVCSDPSGADKDIEQSFMPVDVQESDPDSLLAYYKKALAIRNAYPEIARGRMSIIDSLTDDCHAAIIKTWEDESIGILYNNGEDEVTLDLAGTELASRSVAAALVAGDGASGSAIDGSAGGASADEIMSGDKVTLPAMSIVYLK